MNNSFFPIPIQIHIVLALLALLVFGLQFIRFRKAYCLILAVALPCTLLPYLSDNQTFFYGIGVFEMVALVAALILSQTLDKDRTPERRPEPAPEAVPEDEEA